MPATQKNEKQGSTPKKGKATWRPAQKLEVRNKKTGLRYRMCDKDPENLSRKQAEGWFFANKETGGKAEHVKPGDVADGKEQTTAT